MDLGWLLLFLLPGKLEYNCNGMVWRRSESWSGRGDVMKHQFFTREKSDMISAMMLSLLDFYSREEGKWGQDEELRENVVTLQGYQAQVIGIS